MTEPVRHPADGSAARQARERIWGNTDPVTILSGPEVDEPLPAEVAHPEKGRRRA